MTHHRQVFPAHPLAVAPEELAVLPVGQRVDADRDRVGNRAPEVVADATVRPGVLDESLRSSRRRDLEPSGRARGGGDHAKAARAGSVMVVSNNGSHGPLHTGVNAR